MLPDDRDLHRFAAGEHRRAWEVLGAVPAGGGATRFAVWAPEAGAVAVRGDWNGWRGEALEPCGASGVWALAARAAVPGDHYRYAITGEDGRTVEHADPVARAAEVPPACASIVAGRTRHVWTDEGWRRDRRQGDGAPLRICAVDVGSRRADLRTFAALGEWLGGSVPALGFTHVELSGAIGAVDAPAPWPTAGSWVPSPHHGTPDDFRALVDRLHAVGIGVILRWAPSGAATGGWGAAVDEGRSLLVSNALHWLEEFHVDGLRLTFGPTGELEGAGAGDDHRPGQQAGADDAATVAFLRTLNAAISEEQPTAIVVAGEGARWPRVTHPVAVGGLGFTHKWNVGWAHDTLGWFRTPPAARRGRQEELTFGLVYASDERTVLPLAPELLASGGGGALLAPAADDDPERLADVRALHAWTWAMPGAPLVAMGAERSAPSGSGSEGAPARRADLGADAGLRTLVARLGATAAAWSALWERDSDRAGFEWIHAGNAEHPVLAFLRWSLGGTHAVACIANFGPSPVPEFRIGLPWAGAWEVVVDTDASEHGGAGFRMRGRGDAPGDAEELRHVRATEASPCEGRPASATIDLPPLAVLWLAAFRPAAA